jgi:hypothetical protein
MTDLVIAGTGFRRDAFRLEWQQGPSAGEHDAYQRFLDGDPLTPAGWPEWQAWLSRVQQMTKRALISRVVLLDQPPTQYQQWRIWAAPWHQLAGEDVRFLQYREAQDLGLPIGNWWLFDSEVLVDINGTRTTGPAGTVLYRRGRDLALLHARSAENAYAV